MRIYFTGAHSVGKSTLANYVFKKYNLPLIPEVARTILVEQGISLANLRADLDSVNEFQTSILNRQIEEEKKLAGQSYVSDRSFDCLAYFAQHTGIFSEMMQSKLVQEYFESLKQPDAIIFFVRPCKELLTEDGIREKPSWDGVVQIDAMVKMLIQLYGLRYFAISSPSMQERVNLVSGVLSLIS